MRARTSHSTIGSSSRSSGLGESVDKDVSTGMERGGRRGCDGVVKPGVAGGVNAGEMMEGGGSDLRFCVALCPVLCVACSSTAFSEV